MLTGPTSKARSNLGIEDESDEGPSTPAGHPRTDTPWWRTAVIYQICIRSFADADGDGIGDIAGIRERLPYLRDLGIDAVWITPWYPSPMADGGYDVADHCDIDPLFGTLADADALIADLGHLPRNQAPVFRAWVSPMSA